jgi:hypothetical protein
MKTFVAFVVFLLASAGFVYFVREEVRRLSQ